MGAKTIRSKLHIILAVLSAFIVVGTGAAKGAIKKRPPPEHYRIPIDPKAAEKDLLPTPPKNALPGGPLLLDNLAGVPEVHLHQRVTVRLPKDTEKLDEKQLKELAAAHDRATVHTARLTAYINHLNKKKNDRFMELLMEHRPDLAGLPVVMGDACRLKVGERNQFKQAVELFQLHSQMFDMPRANVKSTSKAYWDSYDTARKNDLFKSMDDRFCGAAGMQMLALESVEHRLGLVERLATNHKTDDDKKAATQALTKLAVFAQDKEIRDAAIAVLQKREQPADTALLLHGLRYPWTSVAQAAAHAIIQLKCKDLIPELIKMLDEPDPRAPVIRESKGKKETVLREVVKINYHRNCLLCHPPGNTPDVMKVTPWSEEPPERVIENGVKVVWARIDDLAVDVLVGAVPTPGQPFPSSGGYREFSSPDLLVRADITYLRQDFSLLQKVADAHPWPEMQRFDYLVRSRVVSEQQAKVYEAEFAKLGENMPYRQTAAIALRRLTGQYGGTTSESWRMALGMK
ncbi:MAG: hypothetical protein EXR98_09840 [Gemmataceae bacterium]|nr:hypothetical protein [Gemmataceae bacterium]